VLNFYIYIVFFYFLFLKLTGYGLIFKDFFKVQVNINLASKIFYFSIWAFFYSNWDQKDTKNTKNK
jgi:hypothetical protein